MHDIGAGNLSLARWLLELGAKTVHAIDKELSGRSPNKRIILHKTLFQDFHPEEMDVTLLSFPINNSVDFVRILRKAKVIIYLGTTTNGCYCGNQAMWRWFSRLTILHYLPHCRNSLIVYENTPTKRESVLDELAGLDIEHTYELEATE